jgi:hypothetical protein
MREGAEPSTYIPADKRRMIYDFMQKVNMNKGETSTFSKLQPDSNAV